MPVLIEYILTGLKVSDANSEIRQTNQGGADNQLAGESCSPGEDSGSEGRQQKIQQESDQPVCSKKSDVGELYGYNSCHIPDCRSSLKSTKCTCTCFRCCHN